MKSFFNCIKGWGKDNVPPMKVKLLYSQLSLMPLLLLAIVASCSLLFQLLLETLEHNKRDIFFLQKSQNVLSVSLSICPFKVFLFLFAKAKQRGGKYEGERCMNGMCCVFYTLALCVANKWMSMQEGAFHVPFHISIH